MRDAHTGFCLPALIMEPESISEVESWSASDTPSAV
jgi:hypothetical protein